VFEEEGALEHLEAFSSFHGPDFYKLPRNTGSITLTKSPQSVPADIPLGDTRLVPIRAGDTVNWTVTRQTNV